MSPYNPHWAQYFQNLISLGPVWLNMAPPPRFSGRRSPALEDRVVGHTPLEPCGNSRGRPCHEGMCHGSDFSGWIQCHAYHPQMVGLGFRVYHFKRHLVPATGGESFPYRHFPLYHLLLVVEEYIK